MTRHITTAIAALLLVGPAMAQERTIVASASLSPETPATGEVRLEVVVTESDKPMTGLKLAASVGMTNMDMGTAHPAVNEVTPGHYVVRPMLLMKGPWRVTLESLNPKFTMNWDLTAGAKEPWKPDAQTIKATAGAMVPDQGQTPMTGGMPMDMPSMPQLKEKSTYNWSDGMDYEVRTRFGKLEPMVRMMILMMVGGSGMEGMAMAPMEMVFDSANFTEGGNDPMKGTPQMDMGSKPLKVKAELKSPKTGDNNVVVTITTPDGKPVEGAKIVTAVGMTNMDMGTTHPAVKELGKGKYSLTAKFSMMGPWRLTLTVTPKGGEPSTYSFDFDAKG